MSRRPAVSVVLPTYNRADVLPVAIRRLIDQTAPPESYELIVVDNNSTDDTAAVLDEHGRRHPALLRTILVRQQGVSYARNAGIAAARGWIVAFCDDDIEVAPNWVETILRVMREHPEIDCMGGKVLPEWSAPPPAWLTPEHWAPLALQDFGDEPFLVNARNPRGLISANFACRREVFTRVGAFDPACQRVRDGIGSLEDDEWMRRFWKTGGRARYTPGLVVRTAVPPERLTTRYHRRWHRGHGRFYALLRAEEFERTSVGRLAGVPAHLYRSAMRDAAGWLTSQVCLRRSNALAHEFRLRFFIGFLSQRLRERRKAEREAWKAGRQKRNTVSHLRLP